MGEWRFDGNGDNQYTGSVATTQGPTGEAVFKTSGGVSNGYAYIETDSAWVEIAHDILYDLPSTFTIEFWFRQRNDQTFSQDLIHKEGEGFYNFRVFRRAWDGVGEDDGAIIAGFTSASGSNPWRQVSNPNNPAHGVWHHVAYAKSTTGQAYYIDGTLINADNDMTDLAYVYPERPIEIGTTAVDTDIDELRISDFAKTVDDISTYYNSFKPVADAGADQNVYGGDAVSLNGSGSSVPTGTTVTYKWTQTSGTSVEISNDTSENASFTAPTVDSGSESLTFQLAVTNNAGQTSSDTCVVTVQAMLAPGTYYVSPGGSDTNDGSAGSPWKTLHHALSQINAGGSGTYVLYVALGPYSVPGESDEALVLTQSNVIIIGEKGSGPIIDGKDAQNWSKGIEITGSNVVVQNLYVTGFSDTDEEGISVMGGTGNEIRFCGVHGNNFGIRVTNGSGTTIRDCDIYDNATHGIDIVSSSGTTVVQNQVHDNPYNGIRTESSSEISRNLIYDNTFGIRVEAITGNTASPTIKNNVIYEVDPNAMSFGIYSLVTYHSSTSTSVASPKIYHNTIDGGLISGIYTEKDTDTTSAPVIKYNIITNFGQYGIQNNENSPADYTINYNNVWNNGTNYENCTAGANDISSDPKYGSYSLQSNSPCINAIPSTEEDPVILDYPGFKRPRPGKETKDMGAYEYVADETVNYTLPGGTGLATDYRIFTVPLNLGTGANMLSDMEDVLGSYDPVHWRAFMFDGISYREFNSSQFTSHAINPGMGFWIITTYDDEIPFTGKPAPDGVDYVMELDSGWHLIGLPWIDTSILLSTIKVTDGVNTYSIIGQPTEGQLTQKILWDFTGDGADSGYVKQTTAGFRLQNNKGYFFKVLADRPVRLIIPHPYTQAENAPVVDINPNQTDANEDDETPPPPPGAEPSPDIKANGQDGPIVVNAGDSVSVSVSLDPGAWSGRNTDWWVAAWTPFDPPWYTYVYSEGWKSGIHACVQTPLFEIPNPVDVLNMVLPVGKYVFYFAVDGNMDGRPDVTWVDSVEVNVQ